MAKLRLSYSALNTYESCPRRFEFDKLYPRLPRDHDTFAADVGIALHAGIQHYWSHKDRDAAIWEFMLRYPFMLEFSQDKDDRSFESALSTLEEMFECDIMADYELAQIRRPWTEKEIAEAAERGVDLTQEPGPVVPAIEVPFEINFKGLRLPPCPKYPEGADISFIGFIDAVMRHVITGHYRSTDVKTNRDFSVDNTAKYLFDSQQVPYGLVIEHLAQGESIETFDVLYMDTLIDLAAPRCQLYSFTKTQDDVQEWLFTRVQQIMQIIESTKHDFFPRKSGGCVFYKRPCRHLTPCQDRNRENLFGWFMEGASLQEAQPDEPFQPWITVDIDPFGASK